ncbi:MAG: hypothetical protein ACLTK8_00085 [Paeniclostridium sp.]
MRCLCSWCFRVSAFTYAPFTFLNIINPFVSLIMIAFGIKIVRQTNKRDCINVVYIKNSNIENT